MLAGFKTGYTATADSTSLRAPSIGLILAGDVVYDWPGAQTRTATSEPARPRSHGGIDARATDSPTASLCGQSDRARRRSSPPGESVVAMRPPTGDDLTIDRSEEAAVAGVETRDFDSPDETRNPDKTQVDVVHLGGTTVGRFAFEPGWRWSECIKPVAGTESCQARHVGVVHSGRLAVKHEDGTEVEIAAGDAYVIEPGHDAWVVGDERFVGFEFEQRAAEEYARS
ncbi:MAG: hypothetical protein QOH62_3579 [Solirubrobacteraceae bacterium]|jgi:hypothetical protein|nr:hypothetical protein [Solirubrobacteraceae bacterium]